MTTKSLPQSRIFATPEDSKKAKLLLSFLTILTVCLAIMTDLLPKGANTKSSFILNYFIIAFALILLYSFLTKKRKLVLMLSGYVTVMSIIFFICNQYADYQKDFGGAVDLRIVCGIVTSMMFVISVSRFFVYKKKNTD